MSEALPSTPARPAADDSKLVCYCRRVTHGTARAAIASGRSRSLADLQRETTACTRCFGCRFELERMLKTELGDEYVPSVLVRPPTDGLSGRRRRFRELRRALGLSREELPQRMYIPVLQRYAGRQVETRLIMFNWYDQHDHHPESARVRADLITLDGTRLDVWDATIAPRRAVVLDVSDLAADSLSGGVGVLKLVIEVRELGSLRPYFQFVTPTGITSTHEKKGTKKPYAVSKRPYHWILPVASNGVPQETYFFCTNTQFQPLDHHALVWQSESGEGASIPLPRRELDQTAFVPLHEHVPAIRDGTASGSVRLSPPEHIAGFMIWYEPKQDLWRVQHL